MFSCFLCQERKGSDFYEEFVLSLFLYGTDAIYLVMV